ncbi:C4-dicarboxylate ABC transporter substrate-binding protein [Salinadaptatus halalkaliphilus]|uniref:C4-dicarboxylate ABC transporter substrate-binding protein n=1 Tax=Salinadaptatus halalkaliphilus TaxID=2419781 RepID=A0A4S3TJF6_9EURY|nr:TAXI family TRAP transporter solute-binding subunit [Salinadaptatus halalkaliphilus]THE64132.1 C4-dicarboxylate ABC transporter substrate-binding protein [Salinadaptatus halalkaliphilus]
MPNRSSNRRRFLKAAAITGTVGIAGCIGDDDVDPDGDDPLDDDDGGNGTGSDPDEDREYHIDSGTSSGGTMDVGLAVEQGVANGSDTLSYSTVESPGYVGTMYRMNEDAFDAGFIDINTMNKAQNNLDMFEDDPVDQLAWQGFRAFDYNIYMMAVDGTGIETFDDLAGADVYPAEPGYSTRATSLDVWSQEPTADIYEEMNIIDMDVSDAPGAMEEGRIEAAIAYGTPGIGNTGWNVEYDARVDVHYVEHTDALVDSIEAFDGAGLSEFEDPEDTFLWDQDIGTDEIVTWDFTPTIAIHPETEDDAAYELARVAGEENDLIREAEERFLPEDPEGLVQGALDEYPFHPGVAEYYQDEGVWNDDWVVGDRDNVGGYFN